MTQKPSTLHDFVKRFEDFAVAERALYSGDDNNLVGTSLGQVGRYLRFLAIAERRYVQVTHEVAEDF